MPASAKILVIGGGISGLACAWRLRQRGLPVLLIERGPRWGGVIATTEENGFRFDVGPQSFTETQALAALIEELGLAGELVRANPRAPRYILYRGKLAPAPLTPPRILRTPLIGWRTRLRLLAEPLRRSHPPAGDESIAAFVRRKFGDDFLAHLVAPFVSGVYAGDPEKLSLRSAFPAVRRLEEQYGSVIRGAIVLRSAMKSRRAGETDHGGQCNFRRGIATLTEALAAKLGDAAVCGTEIASLHRSASGEAITFDVTYRRERDNVPVAASAVVIATPADEAARLLAAVEQRFAAPLARIGYAPLAQVSAGYWSEQIAARQAAGALEGFGFLVPRGERLRMLGTVWNSSLFPGRAPQSPRMGISFTTFAGGATDPEICAWSEEKIAAAMHAELASVLGIEGPPAARHVARWERALPQYNLGHTGIVEELNALRAGTPGVFLAGNYLSGPSLGACVEQANSAADAAARFAATPG